MGPHTMSSRVGRWGRATTWCGSLGAPLRLPFGLRIRVRKRGTWIFVLCNSENISYVTFLKRKTHYYRNHYLWRTFLGFCGAPPGLLGAPQKSRHKNKFMWRTAGVHHRKSNFLWRTMLRAPQKCVAWGSRWWIMWRTVLRAPQKLCAMRHRYLKLKYWNFLFGLYKYRYIQ